MPHSWVLCAEPELDKHYYITIIRCAYTQCTHTIYKLCSMAMALPASQPAKHTHNTLILNKPRKYTQIKKEGKDSNKQTNKMKRNAHRRRTTTTTKNWKQIYHFYTEKILCSRLWMLFALFFLFFFFLNFFFGLWLAQCGYNMSLPFEPLLLLVLLLLVHTLDFVCFFICRACVSVSLCVCVCSSFNSLSGILIIISVSCCLLPMLFILVV